MKPCNEIHPTAQSGCRLCWLWEHDREYRALWGGDSASVRAGTTFKPPPAVVERSVCVHEGIVLEFCHGCSGEMKHVRQCEKFDDKCTRGVVSDKVRSCQTCDDYDPEKA